MQFILCDVNALLIMKIIYLMKLSKEDLIFLQLRFVRDIWTCTDNFL